MANLSGVFVLLHGSLPSVPLFSFGLLTVTREARDNGGRKDRGDSRTQDREGEGLKEGMLGDKNCLLTVRESLLFHQIRWKRRFIF